MRVSRYNINFELVIMGKAQSLPSSECVLFKKWHFSQSCYSCAMSWFIPLVVPACVVNGDSRRSSTLAAYQSPVLAPKAAYLLSHSALVRGVHLKRTCMSMFFSKTSYKYPRMRSLSALSRPTILSVIARLTKSDFHFVAGWTRTSGCSRSTYLGPADGLSRSRYG